MPRSPADTSRRAEGYADSWAEIMRRVRAGGSWSGAERNVCLLNTRDGRFASISSVSGLDFRDDGRAMGIVDWDQDGDLDLWLRNRTAPRLRLMSNTRPGSGTDHVALRLEGTTSNRDGIGAVVELVTKTSRPPDAASRPARLVRSVRAGDLFLAQSSKWLHFGLRQRDRSIVAVEAAEVLWPGGSRERFTGITRGGRFVLKQGTGKARRLQAPTSRQELIPDTTERRPVRSGSARILLPARVPFPMPTFRAPSGEVVDAGRIAGARLVIIWSRHCPHCLGQLRTLDVAALGASGVTVLALSVDARDAAAHATEALAVRRLLEREGASHPWGFIDADSLAAIQVFREALFDRTPAATVPVAFLLDDRSRALAIYRGAVDGSEIAADAGRLLGADAETLHGLAPPLAGTWLTRPVAPVDVAEFLARRFEPELPERALRYLHLAVAAATGPRQAALRRELTGRCHALALEHRRRKDIEQAAYYFEAALETSPEAAGIHADYAHMLAGHGILTKARQHFERALALEPDLESARRGLELIAELERGR